MPWTAPPSISPRKRGRAGCDGACHCHAGPPERDRAHGAGRALAPVRRGQWYPRNLGQGQPRHASVSTAAPGRAADAIRPAGGDAGPCALPVGRIPRDCQDRAGQLLRGCGLLPYRRFLSAAQGCRHDLETLADQFGASLEQVRTACPPCNAPVPRACPSSSCGWTRRARSPSATRPRGCNSRASAGPAPCGTCTARLKHRAGSSANWRKRPDGVQYFCLSIAIAKGGGSFHAACGAMPWAGLRDRPCRCAGLCRRDGPRGRVRPDRHFLPHLRARGVPPTQRAAPGAAGAWTTTGRHTACPTAWSGSPRRAAPERHLTRRLRHSPQPAGRCRRDADRPRRCRPGPPAASTCRPGKRRAGSSPASRG